MVRKAVETISTDCFHGASWLSRRSLGILRLAAREYGADTPSGLMVILESTARALALSHPTMAPLANQVAHALADIKRAGPSMETVEQLRASVRRITFRLSYAQSRAGRIIAAQASRLIAPDDCVGTASYSETFIQVCKTARTNGKPFKVLAAESAFNDHAYGEMTQARLKAEGIETSLVPDQNLANGMRAARRFIVGADTVLPDGSIINGKPSSALALLAFRKGTPFYTVCDSTKICPADEVMPEAGFDLIPGGLLTAVMTEKGPLNSRERLALVARATRWRRALELTD